MPQSRLSLAERQDLASDPRMQNPQIRAQVFAKLAPEDQQWVSAAISGSDEQPSDFSKLPQQAAQYAVDHPAATGATIGGIAAPLLTGGTALLPELAATGLGGMGGAGTGMTLDALRQYFGGAPSQETLPSTASGVAKDMIDQGGGQMAATLAGRGTSAALKGTANGLMDSAIGAQTKLRGEFPDVNLAETLNANAINPFTKKGVQKAGILRRTSAANTQRLADDAGANGILIRRGDVTPALTGSTKMAAEDAAAGMPGGNAQIAAEVDRLFGGRSPLGTGDIPANEAPAVTRSLQRRGRAARAASNAGDLPRGLDASVNDELASGVRQTANQKIGPEYAASNANTQSLIAAQKIAKRGSRQPLTLPSIKATALGGSAGGAGILAGDPIAGAIAASVPLALSVPQISAPVAINLYRAGKIPYALLLKVVGPELLHQAGVTE